MKRFRKREKLSRTSRIFAARWGTLLLSFFVMSSCTLPGGTPVPSPSPSLSPGPDPSPSGTPAPSPNPSGSPTYSVQVSWTPNHESAVNKAQGGYRVYYASAPSVNTSSAPFVNVPYTSGALAPTSANLSGLLAGTYYFRVVAYSALNNKGPDSVETSVSVP